MAALQWAIRDYANSSLERGCIDPLSDRQKKADMPWGRRLFVNQSTW